MIPVPAISEWAVRHPWPTPTQVEQDLLLSQAICAIANDDYLSTELVFRGGTALHKVHLDRPWRYSEDLDYVRSTAGGIGELTRRLTDLGQELGYSTRTKIGMHPKVFWRTESAQSIPIRIKVEVNTHERFPARDLIHRAHVVDSQWWSGRAEVLTFHPSELIATKLRALYQRSKGRDLFDLWLALDELALEPDQILEAFSPYRPERYTASLAIANLRNKVSEVAFQRDLAPLVVAWPPGYDMESAAELVIDQLLSKIK